MMTVLEYPGETPPLKRFLVRTSCEYSIEIDAADAKEAIKKASQLDFEEHWALDWAPFEIDEDYPR